MRHYIDPRVGPARAAAARPRGWRLVRPAAVVALLFGLWSVSPWLAARFAPLLAERLGADALQLEIGRPAWRGVEIRRLTLVAGRFRVTALDGRAAFRPGDLLRGRLASIDLARVTVEVAADTADVASAGTAPAPPLLGPAELFAALPVDAVEVADLQLDVPAVAFVARGGLVLDRSAAELALTALEPARAKGWSLRFEADHRGHVRLRASERLQTRTSPAAEAIVDLRAAWQQALFELVADVRLSGYALDLALELAGLPGGDGGVAGQLRTRLPWPLPAVPDWRQLDVDGDLAVSWAPHAADWGIERLEGAWRMASGVLTGGLRGALTDRGQAVPIAVQAAGLDLSGAWPFGSLQVTLGQAARPVVDLEVRLTDRQVALAGPVRIDRTDWARLARRIDGLPGRGRLTGQLEAAAPRGAGAAAGWLPDWPGMALELRIREFAWTPAEDGAAVERAAGRVRLAGAQIEGELKGRLRTAPVAPGTLADPLLAGPLPFDVRFRGADVLADPLRLEGSLRSGSLGPLRGTLDYSSATGGVDVRLTGEQPIQGPLLAGLVEGWSGPWDIDRGQLGLSANVRWPAEGGLQGDVRVRLDETAAHYGDYAVTGLAGEFAVRLDGAGWRLAPASVRASRLLAGVELADLAARFGGSGEALDIDVLAGSVFDGRLSVAPFRYDLATGTARLDVTVDGLDLARMLALYGERVAGSGLLDGMLPVDLAGSTVTVSAGRLVARAPGGTIRVAKQLLHPTGQPGLDFALRALGDFSYTELTAGVEYAANGDLALAVALKGRNPEVEGGRPIHYNLNITENVPKLLESMTLQDRLVDSIERRLTR